MQIIDAQLHAWTHNSPEYPWDVALIEAYPPERLRVFAEPMPPERVVEMMDSVGVDASLLTSPGIYGSDHSYSFDAAARFPGRFGVVGPLVLGADDLEERVRTFRETPAGIGIRVIAHARAGQTLDSPNHHRLFRAAEDAEVPLFVTPVGLLDQVASFADAYPRLQIVLDHLGLLSFDPTDDPFAALPEVLALARLENIAVKCSGVPGLSSEPYPFRDVWPHLHRVLEAFGVNRVMWGTDATVHLELSYREAIDYIGATDELSAAEKEQVLGGSLRTVVRWDESLRGLRQEG